MKAYLITIILILILPGCGGIKSVDFKEVKQQTTAREHLGHIRNYNLQKNNNQNQTNTLPAHLKPMFESETRSQTIHANVEDPNIITIKNKNNKPPIIVPIMSFVIITGLYLYIKTK